MMALSADAALDAIGRQRQAKRGRYVDRIGPGGRLADLGGDVLSAVQFFQAFQNFSAINFAATPSRIL